MVNIINEALINFVPISDIEIAMPAMNNPPQDLEGLGRAIAQHPSKDTWTEMVYSSPQPDFVFFEPTKVWSSSSSPTSRMLLSAGVSGRRLPSCFTQ